MNTVQLHATRCAICQTKGNATELYPANFDPEAFNPAVFSARRLPDRIHYRMVKCCTCGLVRSDPVAASALLAQLYAQSDFCYADEVASLKLTYGHYLSTLAEFGIQKGTLLEIGCGNGFFLEEALAQGYVTVRGVEPSSVAVAKASPKVQSYISCDIMHSGLFDPGQFDVVCMFQVFDHIPDPGTLLDECFRVLKPGGLLLCLNHNIEAVSARLLKERSPIIDIEHTYLYSPSTMSRIFEVYGFKVARVGSARNTNTLHYLLRLLPLLAVPKRILLALLNRSSVGRIRFSMPLGNLYLVAQKPG
jgi:SAM-dependent methyltransferase